MFDNFNFSDIKAFFDLKCFRQKRDSGTKKIEKNQTIRQSKYISRIYYS